MPTRLSGLTVSVFTLGSAFIDDLEDATLTVENATEEGRGVNDLAHFPIPLRGSWSIEASIFCATTAPLMAVALGTAPSVAVTFTVNPSTVTTNKAKYTGTAVIKTGAHRAPNNGLQKVSATLHGQGALTIASP